MHSVYRQVLSSFTEHCGMPKFKEYYNNLSYIFFLNDNFINSVDAVQCTNLDSSSIIDLTEFVTYSPDSFLC